MVSFVETTPMEETLLALQSALSASAYFTEVMIGLPTGAPPDWTAALDNGSMEVTELTLDSVDTARAVPISIYARRDQDNRAMVLRFARITDQLLMRFAKDFDLSSYGGGETGVRMVDLFQLSADPQDEEIDGDPYRRLDFQVVFLVDGAAGLVAN